MPNEITNGMTTEVNSNLALSSFPYLMQYQFSGNIYPSFSSVQRVPVDVRFADFKTIHLNQHLKVRRNYFQIKAAWGAYPLERHNFKERHNYQNARFDFFYQKAHQDIGGIPDFTVILSKVIIVVNNDLVKNEFGKGIYLQPNEQGTISFEYQHSHCYGNYPRHIRNDSYSYNWWSYA